MSRGTNLSQIEESFVAVHENRKKGREKENVECGYNSTDGGSRVLGSGLTTPFSFFCHLLLIYYRKRSRHPLTLSIICRIFGLGLLGCCLQTCTYTGIGYSSPTLASAITDLTPAFTFILAILSREKLKCLETKARYGVDSCWVLGRFCSSTPNPCSYVGMSQEGSRLYVSMFKPLGIVIAIITGVTLLGDTLYLGSVVGATIIAFGFYSVICGQSHEENIVDYGGINSFKSSSSKALFYRIKARKCSSFVETVFTKLCRSLTDVDSSYTQ
ncbi:WAT1-related protein [Melia azedarach]|uniref:WAT1-related protein n=1 Tax=Melia azedarach TaxID=155640 RepID=A0ACC1XIC8_MELAZ|nr:WAT1-related protein [Melia azedarach]